MGRLQRFGLWTLRTRFPLVPSVVGMVLASPALFGGLQADDLYIRSVVLQSDLLEATRPTRWEPYTYLDGDANRTEKIVERGWMPWWTDPHCKAALFRPLTALSFVADFCFWPDHPSLLHLQSILWYGLVVAVVALLYRRLMQPSASVWAVGLAPVMYAVADTHALPAGWIANRNALLAVFFGVVTLLLYDRGSRTSKKRWLILAALALAASLLSKEEGVSTLGYLFAYAMFLDRRPVRVRLVGMIPCLVVAVAWYVLYRSFGYGVFASEVYVDPGNDPLRFLGRVARNGPILLFSSLGGPPADASLFMSTSLLAAYRLIAVGFIVTIALSARRYIQQSAAARFWLVGALGSLVPVCAVFAGDRLLMFSGIGVMGFLAGWLGWCSEIDDRRASGGRFRLGRFLALSLVLVRLVLSPLVFPVSAISMRFVGEALTEFYETIPDGPRLTTQRVIFVNSLLTVGDLVWVQHRRLQHRPFPLSVLHLSPSAATVRISRPDERTLIVTPHGGFHQPRGFVPDGGSAPMVSPRYHAQLMDMLVREKGRPMLLHEIRQLSYVDIEVTALTPDGRPGEVTFRFRAPLEDPSLRWLYIQEYQFREFGLPAIGESVKVESAL